MNRMLAITATALCLIAARETAAQTAEPWNGFYLGLTVGYLDGRIDEDEFDGDVFEDDYLYEADDISGGVLAGYNRTLSGNWVLGGEVEALFGGSYAYVENDADDEYFLNTDAALSLRGRLGYRISDTTLVYGALGPGIARFDIDWTDSGDTDRQKATATGATIAAGLEYAVAEGISLRGELRHTRYRPFRFETDLYPGFEYEEDIRNSAAMLAVTIQTSRLFGF